VPSICGKGHRSKIVANNMVSPQCGQKIRELAQGTCLQQLNYTERQVRSHWTVGHILSGRQVYHERNFCTSTCREGTCVESS